MILNSEEEEQLEQLWKTRIGLFAKIQWEGSHKPLLSYGVVWNVIAGKVILLNKVTQKEIDIPISKIQDSEVSPFKEDKNIKSEEG